MAVIDTHAHFWPKPLLDYIRAGEYPALKVEEADGLEWLVHSGGLRYELTPTFHDLEAKLERMDADGIDVALDSIPAPYFFYDLPPQETLALSRMFNDAIAEHAAASGGRVHGLATVPLNDPELAAEELGRAHDELELVGVEIGTSLGEEMLDAPFFEPLLAAAAEHGMPLQLHPHLSMLNQNVPVGLDGGMLPVIFANAVETTAAAARLILGGALDRFPKLKVQLVHAGGYFPFQLGRLQRAYEVNPALAEGAKRQPVSYLDNFLFDTVTFEPRAVEFLIGIVGTERVAFGTDKPFLLCDMTGARMEGLDATTSERVLSRNAERVFGIKRPGSLA